MKSCDCRSVRPEVSAYQTIRISLATLSAGMSHTGRLWPEPRPGTAAAEFQAFVAFVVFGGGAGVNAAQPELVALIENVVQIGRPQGSRLRLVGVQVLIFVQGDAAVNVSPHSNAVIDSGDIALALHHNSAAGQICLETGQVAQGLQFLAQLLGKGCPLVLRQYRLGLRQRVESGEYLVQHVAQTGLLGDVLLQPLQNIGFRGCVAAGGGVVPGLDLSGQQVAADAAGNGAERQKGGIGQGLTLLGRGEGVFKQGPEGAAGERAVAKGDGVYRAEGQPVGQFAVAVFELVFPILNAEIHGGLPKWRDMVMIPEI